MLTIVGKIKPDDVVVLELSSFQIEQLAQSDKAPQVALLTNLTPNHLDRYKTFENYCKAKELIFQHQKPGVNQPAVSIFNGDDEVGSKWFAKYQKDAGRVCVKFSTDGVLARIRSSYGLPGRAYLANLAGAIAVAKASSKIKNDRNDAPNCSAPVTARNKIMTDDRWCGPWHVDQRFRDDTPIH